MADIDFTADELASEEWRPIPGWEGTYSASSLGRIRREQGRYCQATRILKPLPYVTGHRYVALFRNNASTQYSVHKLIALAFIGPRPRPADQIDHLNGIRYDNRVANLEYVSAAENTRRGVARTGKMTHALAAEIRRAVASGERRSHVARRLGVPHQRVGSIAAGRSWA